MDAGKRFYAHRIALLASSDAFRAMFDGGYRVQLPFNFEIAYPVGFLFFATVGLIFLQSLGIVNCDVNVRYHACIDNFSHSGEGSGGY